jgi:hypothetical protein
MCTIDYDEADLYKKTERIAMKKHICYECCREIIKDEKYSYVFGVWGKDINTYRTCTHCLIGQNWLLQKCNGFLHGNLQEEIYEHASEYRRLDLYRFVIGMRKKWINMSLPKLKD